MSRYRTTRKESAVLTPKQGSFVSGVRDDYEEPYMKYGLTPARLGSVLRAADSGDAEAMQEVLGAIEDDPHVSAVLSKRRKAVTGKTISIRPWDDSEQAKNAAELCEAAIWGSEEIGGIENWFDALFDLTDAIGKGYSLAQLVWVNDGIWRIKTIDYWPQRWTVVGTPGSISYDWHEHVRVLTDADRTDGEPLDKWQWVLHTEKAKSDVLPRAALLRQIAWVWMFKHFSMRDWSIFTERFGIPYRIGKYPVNASDKEVNAVANAVVQFGKDGGAVLPEGAMIELVESKMSGNQPHQELAAFCNSEISKAILGGTLTTEGGSVGARSLGEVHERAEDDLNDNDCLALARTIRRDILTPIVRFNLGDKAPIPEIEFLSDEQEDLKTRAERDQILVRSIGLPISKRYFYEKYDIPPPEDNDDIVVPPVNNTNETDDIQSVEDAGDKATIDKEEEKPIPNTASKKKSLSWAL